MRRYRPVASAQGGGVSAARARARGASLAGVVTKPQHRRSGPTRGSVDEAQPRTWEQSDHTAALTWCDAGQLVDACARRVRGPIPHLGLARQVCDGFQEAGVPFVEHRRASKAEPIDGIEAVQRVIQGAKQGRLCPAPSRPGRPSRSSCVVGDVTRRVSRSLKPCASRTIHSRWQSSWTGSRSRP